MRADVRLIGIDGPLGWPRRFTDLLIAAWAASRADLPKTALFTRGPFALDALQCQQSGHFTHRPDRRASRDAVDALFAALVAGAVVRVGDRVVGCGTSGRPQRWPEMSEQDPVAFASRLRNAVILADERASPGQQSRTLRAGRELRGGAS